MLITIFLVYLFCYIFISLYYLIFDVYSHFLFYIADFMIVCSYAIHALTIQMYSSPYVNEADQNYKLKESEQTNEELVEGMIYNMGV